MVGRYLETGMACCFGSFSVQGVLLDSTSCVPAWVGQLPSSSWGMNFWACFQVVVAMADDPEQTS